MAPILGNPAMPNLLAGSVPRNVLRSTSGSAAPAPEIGWETLYTRQADIFKQEREVWEQERTLLRNEIERLKAQLASDHSKLGANGQLEDGEVSANRHPQAVFRRVCINWDTIGDPLFRRQIMSIEATSFRMLQ